MIYSFCGIVSSTRTDYAWHKITLKPLHRRHQCHGNHTCGVCIRCDSTQRYYNFFHISSDYTWWTLQKIYLLCTLTLRHPKIGPLFFDRKIENTTIRRFLREDSKHRGKHQRHHSHNIEAPASAPSPSSIAEPTIFHSNSLPSPPEMPSKSFSSRFTPSPIERPSREKILDSTKSHPPMRVGPPSGKDRKTHLIIVLSVAVGSSFLVASSIICFLCCRSNRVVTVMPWKTGLSGQLQKAFVTGLFPFEFHMKYLVIF